MVAGLAPSVLFLMVEVVDALRFDAAEEGRTIAAVTESF